MLSGGVEFALPDDGGEQGSGLPAVGFGVVQAPDDRAPCRVLGQGVGPPGWPRPRMAACAVPAFGELVGGVLVAGDQGGQGSGVVLGGADGLGGGQCRRLRWPGCSPGSRGRRSCAGRCLVQVGPVVLVEGEQVVGGDVQGGALAGAADARTYRFSRVMPAVISGWAVSTVVPWARWAVVAYSSWTCSAT